MNRHGGFIVEFIPVGSYLKVTAVCERTGREVSMIGDPRASQAELERLAVKKLKYVMAKEEKAREGSKRGLSV